MDTYNNGYNETEGGDGSLLYNYKYVVELFNLTKSVKKTAELLNCCPDTVSKACTENGIDLVANAKEQNKKNIAKKVKTIYNGKEIIFSSIQDAANWLIKEKNLKSKPRSVAINISRSIKNQGTCQGFVWNFDLTENIKEDVDEELIFALVEKAKIPFKEKDEKTPAPKKEKKAKPKQPKGEECNKKKVLCIETDKKYSSILKAAEDVGCDNSSITKCCKGKRSTAGGYH